MVIMLLSAAILFFSCPLSAFAQTRFIHSHSGTSSSQLAVWAAKDLNLFAKYKLDVDWSLFPVGRGGCKLYLGKVHNLQIAME